MLPRRHEGTVPAEEALDRRLKATILALLVDDMGSSATSFKQALAVLGIDIVIASNLSQARRLLQARGDIFDAVLLAVQLPDGCGEDLLPEIEALARQPAIVVLTDSLEEVRPDVISYRTVLAPKTTGLSTLAAILHQGANGHADDTLTRFARNYRLTEKESKVLACVARGASPKQTASHLACSVQAIYVHLGGICAKTNCTSYPGVMAKLFQFSCHGLGHDAGAERQALSEQGVAPWVDAWDELQDERDSGKLADRGLSPSETRRIVAPDPDW
jgi:DNA-binding NarL/FixJ family response regulator